MLNNAYGTHTHTHTKNSEWMHLAYTAGKRRHPPSPHPILFRVEWVNRLSVNPTWMEILWCMVAGCSLGSLSLLTCFLFFFFGFSSHACVCVCIPPFSAKTELSRTQHNNSNEYVFLLSYAVLGSSSSFFVTGSFCKCLYTCVRNCTS